MRPRPQGPRPGPGHAPPRPPLLTLKAGSCPSGARCNSRTSSIAFSQNMTDAPGSPGLVNCQVIPNGRWLPGRGTSIVQSRTTPATSSSLWRQTGSTNRSALVRGEDGEWERTELRWPRRDIKSHCATSLSCREIGVMRMISFLAKLESQLCLRL